MSAFMILFVFTAGHEVLGEGLGNYASDSYIAQNNYLQSTITAGLERGTYEIGADVRSPVTITVNRVGSVAGGSTPLNNAAALGAAQLSALQNAQALQATRIGNSAAAAIQRARVNEVAARLSQANAIKNAQALNAARISNVQRAEAAANENARAVEAAKRAAVASALEAARAVLAERVANAARVQAVAIANARYLEAARIAHAVQSQVASVANSAAHTQSVANTIANNVHGAGSLANGLVSWTWSTKTCRSC